MTHHFIIYGYGAMGSAMAHHLYSNNQCVSVRPSPYDNINHIPTNLISNQIDNDKELVHVIATSHKGLNWCLNVIEMDHAEKAKNMLILTKGLMIFESEIMPISTYIKKKTGINDVVALTGPCIANEMMQGEPSSIVLSSENQTLMKQIQVQLQTPHYNVKISDDIMGHQWAAALKNIYAILINASSAFSFATQENFNAAIFHAIHRELSELIARVGGDKDTAFSLSGLGDIWVTCRKGRNGKFGHHWGTAPLTPLQVNSAIFNHTTVEGYMLAMNIAPLWIGTAHLAQFPIISHTITALSHNQGYALLHQKLASYI